MIKGVILVDFNNVYYGDEPCYEKVKYLLQQFITECMDIYPNTEKVEVRLYGGWKSNAHFTHRADMVRSFMPRLNSELFPFIHQRRRILGDVSMVTSQFNLDVEWDDTMQEKPAKHKLKVKMDGVNVCNYDPGQCPMHMIAKATHGETVICPMDGCGTIDISKLIRREQKMVDTMMACDILEYVHEPDYSVIEVVSDDVDLHPAVALAGHRYAKDNHVHLVLMVHNRRKSLQYSALLTPYHVTISNWQ